MSNRQYRYRGTSISGMARGFTGMLSYYAMIGILLGLFACCVGGPLLVARLLDGDGDGGGGQSQAQGQSSPHFKANENTPEWLRPYVGSYDRHGQSLDIAPDGHGVFRSRTYTTCAENPQEPCEKEPGDMPIREDFTVVRNGDQVMARGDGPDVPIVLVKPGIIENGGLTFCESDVIDPSDPAVEACGA
jgi:hypothetical protein